MLVNAISLYNDATPAAGPATPTSSFRVVGWRGFIILDYAAPVLRLLGALSGWLKDGKLKQKEDVALGLRTRRSH